MADEPIVALLPKTDGHQLVMYGNSCSGIPNALHERTFAEVNAIVKDRVGLRSPSGRRSSVLDCPEVGIHTTRYRRLCSFTADVQSHCAYGGNRRFELQPTNGSSARRPGR